MNHSQNLNHPIQLPARDPRFKLKAPFPWFGGKSRAAHLVWERFGDVPNYVEPFFGSGAVMLGRPHEARTETVNDKDCYISNFWRALDDAEQLAHYADWPVNEADLHARHRWLVNQSGFRERMMTEPDFFDAKIAAWWVWGISQWIGSGWCSRPEWVGRTLPGRSSRGVHSDKWRVRPNLTKRGRGPLQSERVRNISVSDNWRKRMVLGRGGRGINSRRGQWKTRPFLSNANGNGLTALSRQLPQISGTGSGAMRGVHSQGIGENLVEYMHALRERLRFVRVCCGDWKRILGRSPTTCIGLTGVFLDPPYSAQAARDQSIYNVEDLDVAQEVAQWAREHGDDPKMRIALCGYEGEHKMPKRWTCLSWKANGGYGNQANGRGRNNAGRERIWFSPHCLPGGAQ